MVCCKVDYLCLDLDLCHFKKVLCFFYCRFNDYAITKEMDSYRTRAFSMNLLKDNFQTLNHDNVTTRMYVRVPLQSAHTFHELIADKIKKPKRSKKSFPRKRKHAEASDKEDHPGERNVADEVVFNSIAEAEDMLIAQSVCSVDHYRTVFINTLQQLCDASTNCTDATLLLENIGLLQTMLFRMQNVITDQITVAEEISIPSAVNELNLESTEGSNLPHHSSAESQRKNHVKSRQRSRHVPLVPTIQQNIPKMPAVQGCVSETIRKGSAVMQFQKLNVVESELVKLEMSAGKYVPSKVMPVVREEKTFGKKLEELKAKIKSERCQTSQQNETFIILQKVPIDESKNVGASVFQDARHHCSSVMNSERSQTMALKESIDKSFHKELEESEPITDEHTVSNASPQITISASSAIQENDANASANVQQDIPHATKQNVCSNLVVTKIDGHNVMKYDASSSPVGVAKRIKILQGGSGIRLVPAITTSRTAKHLD